MVWYSVASEHKTVAYMSLVRKDQLLRSHQIECLFLFFSCLILFTWGLHSKEVIGFDSRFYLFAQEMWRYGASCFPLTYHQPYPDYPASSTLVIYLFACLLGGVTKFTAVLPSAILGALMVTLTYLIGSLQNKRWGWCGAMLLLLTSAFIKSTRAISLDLYPAVMTAGCFYFLYSADKENAPQPLKWVYLLLLLGFVFRGPIGLVMPAGVMCSYYFINRDYKKLFINGLAAFLLLCLCTIILLALAYHVGGEIFMRDVLRMEILGRIDNHYLPRYFYFTNSMASYALAYPAACLVLGGAAFYAYSAHDFSFEKKFILQLFGWMMVIMLGMSIPDDKKVRYVLPMLPAIALIAAYPFVAPISQKYFIFLRTIFRCILFVFPLILMLSVLVLFVYLSKHAHHLSIHFIAIIVFFAVMQCINVLLIFSNKFLAARENGFLGIAALSFVITHIIIIEPILLYLDRAREMVISVETQRIHDHARLVFYKEKPDGLPIKYLINKTADDEPVFIQDEEELKHFSTPAYFITSESYFDELQHNLPNQLHIIEKDKLGHTDVVVFTFRANRENAD